ncbi:MAG TPA: transketolase [Terriglobia bacterium]|nr:transketolase [Terriglobia bacterium]
MGTANIRLLKEKAWLLRRHVVRMVGVDRTGHIGGSCSSAELMAALYFHILNLDPSEPKASSRDRFVLSKGHAALIQYAALAERDIFPLEELDRVKTLGSMLQGHPDCLRTPGIEANTGSLGQGLSIANGMALAGKLNGGTHKVWVLLGDGELNEGQVWEAAAFATHRKLDNVVAIVDRNGLQAMGPTAQRLNMDSLAAKWAAFGWCVAEIDGHDMVQIVSALETARAHTGTPAVVIARTVKGKGLPFAENNFAFHNGMMSCGQFHEALAEIERVIAEIRGEG